MKFIEVTRGEGCATPGSPIGEAMKEAIELAAKEWRNVRLRHNGSYYMIHPNELLSVVEKEEGAA